MPDLPNSVRPSVRVPLSRRLALLLLMVSAALLQVNCGSTSNGLQAGRTAGGGAAGSVTMCSPACNTGEACTNGACQCLTGLALCQASCVDTQSDPQNCGACGTVCTTGQVCAQGACSSAGCGTLTQCGQSCVDTSSNVENCGACGKPCQGGASCMSGACVAQSTGAGGAAGAGG